MHLVHSLMRNTRRRKPSCSTNRYWLGRDSVGKFKDAMNSRQSKRADLPSLRSAEIGLVVMAVSVQILDGLAFGPPQLVFHRPNASCVIVIDERDFRHVPMVGGDDIADLGDEERQILVDAVDHSATVFSRIDPNINRKDVAKEFPLFGVHQAEVTRLQLMNLVKVRLCAHDQSVPLSTTRDAPVVVLAASDAR